MSDKNTTPKKVFNPLLNVSVTGATIDEFTQNAVLCPVPEPENDTLEQIPLNSPSETESTENIPLSQPPSESANINELTQSSVPGTSYNLYQDNSNQFSSNNNPIVEGSDSLGLRVDNSGYQPQEFQTDPNYNSSNSSSGLLSSFTNILSFGGQKKKEEVEKPSIVNSAVEQLLSSPGESNSNPVPLFNPNQANFASSSSSSLTPSPKHATTPLGPPPPSTGESNTYRRQTQKKLAYAPIPGFSSNPNQSSIQNPNTAVPSVPIFRPIQSPITLINSSVNHPISNPPVEVTNPSVEVTNPPVEIIETPLSLNRQPTAYLPPLSNLPPLPYIPPHSRLPYNSSPPVYYPSPRGSVFQPIQTSPAFSDIISNSPTPITPQVVTPVSLNPIPSSIAELNYSWSRPPTTQASVWRPPSPTRYYWNSPSERANPSPSVSRPHPVPKSHSVPRSHSVPTSLNVPFITPSVPSVSLPKSTDAPVLIPLGTPSTSWKKPIIELSQSVATSTSQTTPAFVPPEVRAPFLIPEDQPTNFLIPTTDITEVQSLDGNTSSYFSGFIMSANENSSQATLNTSTSTIRSVSPMIAVESMSDAAVKPNTPPYRPVYHHWFHRKEIEGRVIWIPFSMVDSLALEAAFVSTDIHPEHMVAVDGGRYDVNILRRQRITVYWEGTPTEVRRCSWFFKANNDGKFTPYEENIATKLEDEYKAAYEVNQWHRKVDLPNGETVVFHAPDVLVLFPQSAGVDVWNTTPNTALRPRVVKRGMDEFDIDEGEPTKIDHLLFLVHGIGSVCDLKFRSVEEVVDDFRSISLQLVQSHYKTSCEQGIANRIEVLPVGWHNQLHSDETGIDKKLKSITLESIPKLRDFTNDTLLDILFYTSPVYCQTIISAVGTELNRIYDLFKTRNPGFKGSVSLGGHSLGSLILFDILCHQHPPEKEEEEKSVASDEDQVPPLKSVKKPPPHQRRLSRRISYMMGNVGTGQPQITYPHLNFHPIAFFALGSPIGMFVTVRGLESLGEQFGLPTCPGFFNIFHPYDPVAYRIESLINSDLGNVRPVLIPHHKGRKRMHLELKETMARVGADLKQRIVDSMKNTWNSVYQFTMFHRQDTRSLEAEVEKVLEEQLIGEDCPEMEESCETDLPVGILNNGRRIDYVLQEAPFEFFNEYIFALTSHVCYWESEDTMLLILKEIYSSMGIQTDSKIPQQTMSVERVTSSPSTSGVPPRSLQMADPLRPMAYNPNQNAPSTSGFIRKT